MEQTKICLTFKFKLWNFPGNRLPFHTKHTPNDTDNAVLLWFIKIKQLEVDVMHLKSLSICYETKMSRGEPTHSKDKCFLGVCIIIIFN